MGNENGIYLKDFTDLDSIVMGILIAAVFVAGGIKVLIDRRK
jgi:hypothetical protein